MKLQQFEDFLAQGIVKKQSPNKFRAVSLMHEANQKKQFLEISLKNIPTAQMNANFIVESCYDILLELIRAKLFLQGYNSASSHEAEVSYLRILGFPEADVQFLNEVRYYRNGIKYYGKSLDMEYARLILEYMKKIHPHLLHLLFPITHIFFDLEGTLVANPSYEKAVADFVYQLYAECTRKPITEQLKKEFDALLKQHKRKSFVFVVLGKPKTYYTEAFAQQFPFQNYIFPDKEVREVIAFLKQKKIKLGVYTSLTKEVVPQILKLLGIDPADFILLTGDMVKNQKPHPEGFEKIIQLCHVPAEQIVFIGDSEFKDIISAKSIGMKTILVRSKEKLKYADYTCREFGELIGIFEKVI